MKLTFQIEYRTAWGEEIGIMLKGQENTPFMSWYPSYKQKPVSFTSKVNQIPNVIAYHLKAQIHRRHF